MIAVFASIRGRIIVTAVLSVGAAAASVVPFVAIVELARVSLPALDGTTIDSTRAWSAGIVAVAALVARFALSWAAVLVSHLADNELQRRLRATLIARLRTLPLGWFSDRNSGIVKKTVENDVAALHQLIGHTVGDLAASLTIPVVALGYLFTTDRRMALACLVPILLVLLAMALTTRGAAEKYAGYETTLAQLGQATIEFVHGISVVKAFGQAGRSHHRYREQTTRFTGFYDDWMRQTALGAMLIEAITSPVLVLAYLAGVSAWLVLTGRIEPVDTLPALLLGLALTAPLTQLGLAGSNLRAALAARASLTELLAQQPIPQPSQPRTPDDATVELDGVGFSYDGRVQALEDISLTCPPGSFTALVGPPHRPVPRPGRRDRVHRRRPAAGSRQRPRRLAGRPGVPGRLSLRRDHRREHRGGPPAGRRRRRDRRRDPRARRRDRRPAPRRLAFPGG